jgi:hypothetical protein
MSQQEVMSKITACGLTAGKIYNVIFEYDTVYELECDGGKVYCRNKGFFCPLPPEPELGLYCSYCEHAEEPFTDVPFDCKYLKCDEAKQKYIMAYLQEVLDNED